MHNCKGHSKVRTYMIVTLIVALCTQRDRHRALRAESLQRRFNITIDFNVVNCKSSVPLHLQDIPWLLYAVLLGMYDPNIRRLTTAFGEEDGIVEDNL